MTEHGHALLGTALGLAGRVRAEIGALQACSEGRPASYRCAVLP
jgi:hypothetical protein